MYFYEVTPFSSSYVYSMYSIMRNSKEYIHKYFFLSNDMSVLRVLYSKNTFMEANIGCNIKVTIAILVDL